MKYDCCLRSSMWCVVITGLVALLSRGIGLASEEQPAGRPIRVAIYADEGASKKGSPRVQQCLPAEQGFELQAVTAAEIRDGVLKDYEVLVHPGGSASKQAATLGEEGRRQVRDFVERGGGVVGICAGAYLLSANYSWSLDLLDARVVDSEHWARGNGKVKLRLPEAGRTAFGIDRDLVTIQYAQGPLLAPGEKPDIEDYELLASFETEIAENGAPSGVMVGTTAIARGTFGKGRVICFSPHPEKTRGCHPFLAAAVRWAAGREELSSEAAEEINGVAR